MTLFQEALFKILQSLYSFKNDAGWLHAHIYSTLINQADADTDASQTRQLSSAFDMLIICLVPEGMWTLLIPSSLRRTAFPDHLYTSVGHLDVKGHKQTTVLCDFT